MSEKKLKDRIEEAEQKFRKEKSIGNPDSSLGGRLIIDLIAGIIVGGFLGYILDNYFGTLPLFAILLLVFGSFGGLYSFYKDMNRK